MLVMHTYTDLAAWQNDKGQPVALTIGFFDGLHRGHAHLLAQLKLTAEAFEANPLVVTFANAPRGYHQPEREWLYLTTPDEKQLLLSANGIDDILLLNYSREVAVQTAHEFLVGLKQQVHLQALIAGYDSRLGCDQISGWTDYCALCRDLHLNLVYVEPLYEMGHAVKSRAVRDLVAAGDVSTAAKLLGHPYIVLEQVRHGKGRGGQRLGMPTANLLLPREKLAPPTGVYACQAYCTAGSFPAAVCVMSAQEAHRTVLEREAHLGDLPTEEHRVVVEAHLIGFQGDLYGTSLLLTFYERLRSWEEFATVSDLQVKLADDIRRTESVISLHQSTEEIKWRNYLLD